jgi:uncharacterized protein with HEPN domain
VSPRDLKTRLQDIVSCSVNIQSFIEGMTLDSFMNDPKTIRAVAFELSTIGEAVRTIPNEVQLRYPEVPWGKMLGIRNVLIHEYYRLDEEILWETCINDISPIIFQLNEIISQI